MSNIALKSAKLPVMINIISTCPSLKLRSECYILALEPHVKTHKNQKDSLTCYSVIAYLILLRCSKQRKYLDIFL